LIFTFNPENSVRQSFIENTVRTLSSHSGEVFFIEVVCDPAELHRRMDTPDRRNHKKLVSLDLFHQLKSQGVFDSPELPSPRFTLDSTSSSPRENALKIIGELHLPTRA
jgi:hypothetical protein